MYIAISLVLLSSFLGSFTHHIDKYLLSITGRGGNFKGLIIFSSLIGGLVLSPVFLIYSNFNVLINITSFLILFLAALLFVFGTWFYYKGLYNSETSSVAVMLQMLPIVSLIISIFVIGDHFEINQIIGSLLIVLSSILVTFEFGSHKIKVKKLRTLIYVFISVIFYAAYYFLFDYAISQNSFISAIFWYQISLFLIGLLLIINKQYRISFVSIIRKNGFKFFVLNLINETLSIVASILIAYSFLFSKVAISLSITAFQPLFVFLVGIVGEAFLPKIFYENIKLKSMIFKFICLIIAITGVILIN